MVTPTAAEIRRRVGTVEDPEMPVPIADLGMVQDVAITGGVEDAEGPRVRVRLVPTYSGCAAQLFIEADVRRAVTELAPAALVSIEWVPTPWGPDQTTPEGRRRLAAVGVAVPAADGSVACPYCGSGGIRIESTAGSSLCRSLGYCPACRNPVEVLKAPGAPSRRPEPVPVALTSMPSVRKP